MKWSIEKKATVGFGLILALFVGTIVIAYQSTLNLVETSRWVSHTHEVLREIEALRSTVTEAESGQQGYVITGDEAYLRLYDDAAARVDQHLTKLHELTVDNPNQQRRLASLDGLVASRLDTMRTVIAARSEAGYEAARDLVLSGPGKDEMAAIRGITGDMQNEETTLLAQRSAESRASTRQAAPIFFLFVVLVVAMLFFVNALVRRDSRERRRAEEEIRKLNAGLEERVSERTMALQTANAELEAEVVDRKRAEGELRNSEGRFNAFMDNSPALAWLKDENGYFVYANRTFRQALNYTLDELSRKTAFDLWPAEMAERIRQDEIAVLATGETLEKMESSTTLNGSLKYLLTFRFPVEDASGKRFIGGVAIDITERKEAEEALRQAMSELAHSNAELQQFAYVASHDLQEPLRMVASYTQLLARRYKDKLDDDAHEFISYAVDGANRMQKLINDLLSYSRLTTKTRAFERVDFEVILSDTLANLQLAIEENDVTITHDPLPAVMGDDVQLSQLLQNLIGNAIKFRGSEPQRIHIGVERAGDQWVFCVRDNGIGMEPQYFERIFVIFQRLHAKSEYPGTGIGLAICKRVVERHGGRIWVASEPGKGTTFYFSIPFAATPVAGGSKKDDEQQARLEVEQKERAYVDSLA